MDRRKVVRVSVTVVSESAGEEKSQLWLTKSDPQTILKTAKLAEKTGINRIAGNRVMCAVIRLLPGYIAGAIFAKWLLSVL